MKDVNFRSNCTACSKFLGVTVGYGCHQYRNVLANSNIYILPHQLKLLLEFWSQTDKNLVIPLSMDMGNISLSDNVKDSSRFKQISQLI